MPNQATLSIAGLYSWDDHIFDLLQLPSGVNRQAVIDNILLECAELTVIYPDWNFMRRAIGSWSAKELEVWNRLYDLEQMEYNPIENYDRFEDEVENISAINQENVSDKHLESSQTGNVGVAQDLSSGEGTNNSVQNTDTINRVAGFNTDSLANQSEEETKDLNTGRTGNLQTTHTNAQNTEMKNTNAANTAEKNATNDQSRGRTSRIHGNIGVTTSQMMVESEWNLRPKVHIDDYIINSFKERFCILVY